MVEALMDSGENFETGSYDHSRAEQLVEHSNLVGI